MGIDAIKEFIPALLFLLFLFFPFTECFRHDVALFQCKTVVVLSRLRHFCHLLKFTFGNGFNIIIEQTAAFCSIDINSGSAKKYEPNDVNLESVKEIIRNLNIRGISGKVVIDFLPVSKALKQHLYQLVINEFEQDYSKTQVQGWTRGQNFEILKERDRIPVEILLSG